MYDIIIYFYILYTYKYIMYLKVKKKNVLKIIIVLFCL